MKGRGGSQASDREDAQEARSRYRRWRWWRWREMVEMEGQQPPPRMAVYAKNRRYASIAAIQNSHASASAPEARAPHGEPGGTAPQVLRTGPTIAAAFALAPPPHPSPRKGVGDSARTPAARRLASTQRHGGIPYPSECTSREIGDCRARASPMRTAVADDDPESTTRVTLGDFLPHPPPHRATASVLPMRPR